MRTRRSGWIHVQMDHEDWLELLPDAALVVDSGGTLVARNAAAAALLDPATWDCAAIAGFDRWLSGSGGEPFRSRWHASRVSGVPVTVELRARRLPGPMGGAV